MKTIQVEIVGVGKSRTLKIERGTKTIEILDALDARQYQLGKRLTGGNFSSFEDEEIIYGKVEEEDKLYLVPRSDIDPPFHPEKHVKIIEAGNGKVHQIPIKQGDKIEKVLDRLGLKDGTLYREHALQFILSDEAEPFEDVNEGEQLLFFTSSGFPTALKNYLMGGD